MTVLNKVLLFSSIVLFVHLLCISGVFAVFHFNDDNVASITANDGDNEHYLLLQRFKEFRQIDKPYYSDWINVTNAASKHERTKRQEDSTFHGHPKTREERWHASFNLNRTALQLDQAKSLVTLLGKIIDKYLNACIPIVFYDQYVDASEDVVLQSFFQSMKISYLHGLISENYSVVNQDLLYPYDKRCRSYVLFISDVLRTRDVLGPQISNRVILIPRSTQWKLQEFLSSKQASDIINLLVIGESLTADPRKEKPYVLYTHKLYVDGLGSNTPVVLTSWIKGKLSRPNVNLFPRKFTYGFSTHRFTIAAINQPPFILKGLSTDGVGNTKIDWDGYEMRLVMLMSQRLNFSYEIIEPLDINELGRTYGVIDMVEARQADIGLAGAFISKERTDRVEMSFQHSSDCAAFITLASKALPRYRAIMGPFQWPVWLAIIATYLFAIFPLAFSDRLTLRHLIGNWGEMENMFWYVFGTFTNSLTFTGEYSWSNTKKTSTRMLIGCYWVFSIIITACYTGSIIAFVTLPVFPDTIDTIDDLIDGFYRVGTLSLDGWQYWFSNSTDEQTSVLLKNLELVDSIEEGLGNVTAAFFWGYAFMGSRAQLEFLVQNNMTGEVLGRKSTLHIADQCLSHFGVAMIYPLDSVYANLLNDALLSFAAAGLDNKIRGEMAWDMQRSDAATLLLASKSKSFSFADVVERKLNLADTEGMFLLMAAGYIVAGSVLVSEVVGGCAQKCRQLVDRRKCALAKLRRGSSTSTKSREKSKLETISEKLAARVFTRFRRNSEEPSSERRISVAMPTKHKRNASITEVDEKINENATDEQTRDIIFENEESFREEQTGNEDEQKQKHNNNEEIPGENSDVASLMGSSSLRSVPHVQEEHVVDVIQIDSPEYTELPSSPGSPLHIPPANTRNNSISTSGEFGEKIDHPETKQNKLLE